MQVLLILYKSALELARVEQLFRERASKYRRVPGLSQKLYVHDASTGEVGGVYVFDTKSDLDAFRSSDLEKSIRETYQFTEPPVIRAFDVVQALHEERAPEADGANAGTFRRIIDEAFNRGELEALDGFLAPGYVDHQDGIKPANAEGVKAFIRAARTAFPDLRLTVEELVTLGDRTWARTTARGTHRGTFMGLPPTGRPFTITRFDTCRYEAGRIAEHWGVIDRLALLQQLGARMSAPPTEVSHAAPR